MKRKGEKLMYIQYLILNHSNLQHSFSERAIAQQVSDRGVTRSDLGCRTRTLFNMCFSSVLFPISSDIPHPFHSPTSYIP